MMNTFKEAEKLLSIMTCAEKVQLLQLVVRDLGDALHPLYKQYLNNIHLAGLDDYVIPHIGYSNQIAKTWSGEDIRLLFKENIILSPYFKYPLCMRNMAYAIKI